MRFRGADSLPPVGPIRFRPICFGPRNGGSSTGKKSEDVPPPATSDLKLYKTVCRNLCRLAKWFDQYPAYKSLLSSVWRLPNEKNHDVYTHQLKRVLGKRRTCFLPDKGDTVGSSLTNSVARWVRRQTAKENRIRRKLGLPLQWLREADIRAQQTPDNGGFTSGTTPSSPPEVQRTERTSPATLATQLHEESGRRRAERKLRGAQQHLADTSPKPQTGRVLNIADICYRLQRSESFGGKGSSGQGGIVEAVFCAMRHLGRLKQYAYEASDIAQGDAATDSPPLSADALSPSQVRLDATYPWTDEATRQRWKSAFHIMRDLDSPMPDSSFPEVLQKGMLLVAHPLSVGIWSRAVIVLTQVPHKRRGLTEIMVPSYAPKNKPAHGLSHSSSAPSLLTRKRGEAGVQPHTTPMREGRHRRSSRSSSRRRSFSGIDAIGPLLLRELAQQAYVTGVIINKPLSTLLGSSSSCPAPETCTRESGTTQPSSSGSMSLREKELDLLRSLQESLVGLLRRQDAARHLKESPPEAWLKGRVLQLDVHEVEKTENQPQPARSITRTDGSLDHGAKSIQESTAEDVSGLHSDSHDGKVEEISDIGEASVEPAEQLSTTRCRGRAGKGEARTGYLRTTKFSGYHRLMGMSNTAVTFLDGSSVDAATIEITPRPTLVYRRSSSTRRTTKSNCSSATGERSEESPRSASLDMDDSNCLANRVELQKLKDLLKDVRGKINWKSLDPRGSDQQQESTENSDLPRVDPRDYLYGGPVCSYSVFHKDRQIAQRKIVDDILYGGWLTTTRLEKLYAESRSESAQSRMGLRQAQSSNGDAESCDGRAPGEEVLIEKAEKAYMSRAIGACGWTVRQLLQEIKRGNWIPLRVTDPSVMEELVWAQRKQDAEARELGYDKQREMRAHTGSVCGQQMQVNDTLWKKILASLGDTYEQLGRIPLDTVEKCLADALVYDLRKNGGTPEGSLATILQPFTVSLPNLPDYTWVASTPVGSFTAFTRGKPASEADAAASTEGDDTGVKPENSLGATALRVTSSRRRHSRKPVSLSGARKSRGLDAILTWWLTSETDSEDSSSDEDLGDIETAGTDAIDS